MVRSAICTPKLIYSERHCSVVFGISMLQEKERKMQDRCPIQNHISYSTSSGRHYPDKQLMGKTGLKL
jgi:hypothetical protein